jgi:hypothetical protein
MSDVATELDQLRIALGEVSILATVTVEAYDSENWDDSDPDVAEGIASLLGLIKKSAMGAMATFHRLHGAIADATPAPSGTGEAFDYSDGTAPGGDPASAASAPRDELAASARDAEFVRRLRERCAAQLGRPVDYPFFLASYLAGEAPDAALLRLFRQNQQLLGRTDDDVIAAMVQFALVHETPSDPGGHR